MYALKGESGLVLRPYSTKESEKNRYYVSIRNQNLKILPIPISAQINLIVL